jgi:hypothetical protein
VDFEWSWHRFLWGVLGAAAPEVVRLYKLITDAKPLQQLSSNIVVDPMRDVWLRSPTKLEVCVSLAFLALGGAFAVAWGENSALKCLWVGGSLPAIVSAYTQQIPPRLS